jgi:lysophospholipase L1-like esterase
MTIGRLAVLIAVLSLALLASLLQQRRLTRALADRDWDIHQLMVDPVGAAKPWPIAPNPSSRCRVVVLGDSRARQWSPPAEAKSAGAKLDWINRGLDGQSTAQVRGRWRQILAVQPDVVVLQVGVNDLWRREALAGMADSPDGQRFGQRYRDRLGNLSAPTEETWTELRQLLDEMTDANLPIVVTTIFPMGPNSSPRLQGRQWLNQLRGGSIDQDATDRVSDQIATINQRLLALKQDNLTRLDAGQSLVNDRGTLDPSHWRDGLHLSEAGYRALDGRLLSAIDRACLGHNRR